jgi:hypothetical protein
MAICACPRCNREFALEGRALTVADAWQELKWIGEDGKVPAQLGDLLDKLQKLVEEPKAPHEKCQRR